MVGRRLFLHEPLRRPTTCSQAHEACGRRSAWSADGRARGEEPLVAGTATQASLETVSGLTGGNRALSSSS